ncbi:MAG TPA: protein-glutamate O-methyltransferase CheR [Novosphingobium sp.]|nr:protein-glutamate O-methyltransferase CheR [Novosphingobium sp.]
MDRALHQHAIGLIAKLLRERTGQVISADRRWRIDGAIEVVLRKRGISGSHDILTLLTQPDSAAVEQELIEALLNNETYFFRDRQVFTQIARNVLPTLCQARAGSRKLRIWSAGCSTGQEPLSLAIMLIEEGITPANGWSVDLVATDVSRAAIDFARTGFYSRFEIQRGLGVSQMLRYFTETEEGWQATRQVLGTIRYQVANLLEWPSQGPSFDLILCRNLMLYFDDEAKRTACERLHASLAPDGRLLLGGGEGSLDRSSGFVPAAQDAALYRVAAQALAA